MKLILRTLSTLLILVTGVVLGVFAVARFHDGPLEGALAIVAAGPFDSGEMQTGTEEPDWEFLRDYSTVQFQLLDPVRSRTTWIMEHEGRIFIPSGYMNSLLGKIWKHWPKEAEEDGRVLLRVDGNLYERQMVRIRDEAVATPVLSELGRKYVGGSPIPFQQVESGDIWLFELQPRS
jgi:hypothetical protein|tara:strand:- start:3449 stop:3979 length:531 start_codon:yes stop_codon:yes gene_type:complete